MPPRSSRVFALVVFVLSLLPITVAAQNTGADRSIHPQPPHSKQHNIASGLNLYSESMETKLGNEVALQFENRATIIADPATEIYLKQIIHGFLLNPEVRAPSVVKIVFDVDVNAYALPGHLYVNTGLILAAENEAELAGAIAHELAHLSARHGTKGLTRQRLWSAPWLPLCGVGLCESSVFKRLSAFTSSFPLRKYERDAEYEADRLAVEYAFRSGYDPEALADLLGRLPYKNWKRPHFLKRVLETHPYIDRRIHRIREEAAMLSQNPIYVLDTHDFQEMKGNLARRVQQEIATRRDHRSECENPHLQGRWDH
jgi:predicted Zn-dependent protease